MPYLSALEVRHDKVVYKSTFTYLSTYLPFPFFSDENCPPTQPISSKPREQSNLRFVTQSKYACQIHVMSVKFDNQNL